jgi:hypothetical protein
LDELLFGPLQASPKLGCLGSSFSEFLDFHVHLPICSTAGKFDDAVFNGFFSSGSGVEFLTPSPVGCKMAGISA